MSRVFIRFSLEAAEQAIKNHFSISTMPMIDMHVSVEKLTKTNLDEMLFDQIGVRDFHFLEGILFRNLRVSKCMYNLGMWIFMKNVLIQFV